MTVCSSKIVVFDLDETLGYFMEFGMFWDALTNYIKYKKLNVEINQTLFNNLLDLYPEFLRPEIMPILTYIKTKKEKNICSKIMIYTNNQGPDEWAKYILNYFDNKLNYKLFDKIIGAFKIRGKTVEMCRTTHMKTHADFIKCTKLPQNTHICFLDDVFYPDMTNDNIYYINIKPYIHDLEFNKMIDRLLVNTKVINYDLNTCKDCKQFLLSYLNKYNYIYKQKIREDLNLDEIISKKIMQHLHKFFKQNKLLIEATNKTRRHKNFKNKTSKRK